MSKKLAGKKFSGSHGTVIDAAYDLVLQVANFPEVTKIALGIIRSCRNTRSGSSLKIKSTSSGIELVIRGNYYIQTIYLYLSSVETKDLVSNKILTLCTKKLGFLNCSIMNADHELDSKK